MSTVSRKRRRRPPRQALCSTGWAMGLLIPGRPFHKLGGGRAPAIVTHPHTVSQVRSNPRETSPEQEEPQEQRGPLCCEPRGFIVTIVVIIIIIVIIDITITIITKLSSTSSSPSPLQGFSYGIPLYLKAIQGSALGLGWCNICRQRTEPWARRVSRHYVYSCHFLFQELKLLNLRLLIVAIVFNTAVIFGFVVVISRISITSISMASMGLFLFCWYDFSRPLQ